MVDLEWIVRIDSVTENGPGFECGTCIIFESLAKRLLGLKNRVNICSQY